LGAERTQDADAEHEAAARHQRTIPGIVHEDLLWYYEWKILHTGEVVNLA